MWYAQVVSLGFLCSYELKIVSETSCSELSFAWLEIAADNTSRSWFETIIYCLLFRDDMQEKVVNGLLNSLCIYHKLSFL